MGLRCPTIMTGAPVVVNTTRLTIPDWSLHDTDFVGIVDAVSSHRRLIPATCRTHCGARGFCNLCLTKEDGAVLLDPHVTGACVIELDETAVTQILDVLGEWFG
jgi:hypothetical protein